MIGPIAGGHGGVPRYAAALSSALDRVSPEFPNLVMRLLTTPRGAERVGARRLTVEVIRRPFASANDGPRRILAEQLRARRLDADLLHFFDLTGPVLAPRRPFVTTIHDAAPTYGFERLRMAHKRYLVPFALKRCAAAVAVSGFARDEAVRLHGADPSRITVIHSGPGFGLASQDVTISKPGPYLLYVGNLAPNKNLPFLIEAFGAAEVDARLILVGRPGARFGDVSKALEACPRRDLIEVRSDAGDDEVDRLYRGASMLLLPSRYEGFGFTALEAMKRGCPVLASDIPALREVSGGGALLLPLDDRRAWAEAMGRVLADPGFSEALRRRGEETVARYSWEKTARGLCRLFVRLEAGSPR